MSSNREHRTILIVDSDPSQQRLLAALLGRGGWRAAVVDTTDGGLAYVGRHHGEGWGAVLRDCRAEGLAIPAFVAEICRWRPQAPIIAITDQGGVDAAIAAMRAGATDFVQKPLLADRLLEALERATHKNAAKEEL